MQRDASPALQRVTGWLAMTLQGACGPLGRSVQYTHPAPDMITVQWAGGPTAPETAARLQHAADDALPITEIANPTPESARLNVDGVTVLLRAHDPEPGDLPPPVDEDQAGSRGEVNVLRWRGVARHGVLWRLLPDQEADGVIVERSVERDNRCPGLPAAYTVALANPAFPDWAGKRHSVWSSYRASTSIVLWDATDLDVSERELEAELRHGYALCAGIIRRRELVLRTHPSLGSWHIHARTDEAGGRTDMVAAALTDAALHTGQPPQYLRLAHLGDAYSRNRWHIDAAHAAPIS